jgi:hypothetical protein
MVSGEIQMFRAWLTTPHKGLISRREASGFRLLAVPVVYLIVALFGLPLGNSSYASATNIVPATLATIPAHVGLPYQVSLSFGSGAVWSVTSGELPPGLALVGGSISGVPTQPGAYTFAVHALATDGSSATKTYSLFVYPSDATGYEIRMNQVIQNHVDYPWPPMTGCTDHKGYLSYGMAELWLNENTADANNKLAAVQISHVTGQNCGANSNLWLSYLARPYFLFHAASSFFHGRMTTAASDNLLAQMWAYAGPNSSLRGAGDPWSIDGSENQDAQGKSFDLLAAQAFKHRPEYLGKIYQDGSTVTQQYRALHDHWNNYFDERAKRGLFVEVGAPSYHGYTQQAILNIYDFAEDPILRKKAGMILDLDFADYAQQQLQNVGGGAKSRSYPLASYDGQADSMTYAANLLYGPSPSYGAHIMALATSGYYPPEVVRSLETDTAGNGSYEYVTRRPGVGPSGWDQNQDWHVDTTKSIRNDTYTTPDYVLGTASLKPGDTHIGPSNQNRWQGIIFNTSPDARVYPQAAPTSVAKTQDAFFSVQKKNVLITRKNGYTDQPTLVYFPASLDTLDEQSGWLFVQEGRTYLAVRPLGTGYTWLDPAKNKAVEIDRRFIKLSAVGSPIIFEAATVDQYATFDAFKSDILNNPRSYTNGVLNYTASNGTTFTFYSDATTPHVNGVPINYAPMYLFNSPFMKSLWLSGKITITKGSLSATYDFSDTANPVKVAS